MDSIRAVHRCFPAPIRTSLLLRKRSSAGARARGDKGQQSAPGPVSVSARLEALLCPCSHTESWPHVMQHPVERTSCVTACRRCIWVFRGEHKACVNGCTGSTATVLSPDADPPLLWPLNKRSLPLEGYVSLLLETDGVSRGLPAGLPLRACWTGPGCLLGATPTGLHGDSGSFCCPAGSPGQECGAPARGLRPPGVPYGGAGWGRSLLFALLGLPPANVARSANKPHLFCLAGAS